MSAATSISSIMEQFGKLTLDDRGFAIDLMQRQMVEARRKALGLRAAQAFRHYKQGKARRGTVADLHKALEND